MKETLLLEKSTVSKSKFLSELSSVNNDKEKIWTQNSIRL